MSKRVRKIVRFTPQKRYVRSCHTLTRTPRIQQCFRHQFHKEANKRGMGIRPRETSRAWRNCRKQLGWWVGVSSQVNRPWRGERMAGSGCQKMERREGSWDSDEGGRASGEARFPRGGDRGREVLDGAAGRGLKTAGAEGGSGPAPRPIGFPGKLGQAPPPATASRTPCLSEPCGRHLTSG